MNKITQYIIVLCMMILFVTALIVDTCQMKTMLLLTFTFLTLIVAIDNDDERFK